MQASASPTASWPSPARAPLSSTRPHPLASSCQAAIRRRRNPHERRPPRRTRHGPAGQLVDSPAVDGEAMPTIAPQTGLPRSTPVRGGVSQSDARGPGHPIANRALFFLSAFWAWPAGAPLLQAVREIQMVIRSVPPNIQMTNAQRTADDASAPKARSNEPAAPHAGDPSPPARIASVDEVYDAPA
jgi:hypothetical protein